MFTLFTLLFSLFILLLCIYFKHIFRVIFSFFIKTAFVLILVLVFRKESSLRSNKQSKTMRSSKPQRLHPVQMPPGWRNKSSRCHTRYHYTYTSFWDTTQHILWQLISTYLPALQKLCSNVFKFYSKFYFIVFSCLMTSKHKAVVS